jgi:lysophospholipase L1-like esterase
MYRDAKVRSLVLLLALARCAGPSGTSHPDAAPEPADAPPAAPSDASARADAPNPAADAASTTSDAARPVDATTTTADANSAMASVRFVGRVDHTRPEAPRFAWSGTTVLARFTGSSIGVRLGGPANYFDIRIDGALQPMPLATAANKQDYPLATNLAAGPHELSVYRRTEARQGESTFLGLILDAAGALLPPPPPAARRLEIVGDSTTTGYGVEGANANCPFTPATENYDVTYGAVTARAVAAELVTIAWTAKGMYRNFAGDMTDTIPALYARTLGVAASPPWDFSSWIPDAVVINLGSNDFEQGDPGQPFVTTYTAFVRRVRQNYPKAFILCVVGPKLSARQVVRAGEYVKGLVTALNTAGDAQVGYLELPQPLPAEGVGCGGHASVATHKHMADVLTAELKAKLGW